jgi:transposase-like protein
MSILSKAYFHNEEAAFKHVEAVLWPNGPVCPHCGAVDRIGKIQANPEKRVRLGLHKCGHCKGQFTVRNGTVFEASKVPLHKWLQALHLMVSSKKGISAHQMHRVLEVTYKTAWFMAHRIREAMRSGDLAPMGGNGGIVEVDETFIGQDPAKKKSAKARGSHHKMKVLSLVDRSTGRARSMVVDDLKAKTLVPILRENIAKESTVYTDEAGQYGKLADDFAIHDFVRHSAEEYARGFVHTNTIEGYFSIFKRGMKGVYQHCAKRHLHRYMAEFDFRYSNRSALGVEDQERARIALKGIVGKRLKYQGSYPT